MTDTLRNDVINKMRSQYLDDERRAEEIAREVGNQHLAVVKLHRQMQDLRRTIFQELKRTAETYRSDFDIAAAREASLEQSLNHIVAASNSTAKAQIGLHDLQSIAQTFRDLYDNFLQRYMQSVQQQSSPVSESRLITHARPPLGKAWPRPLLIMAVAGLGGLIFGA